MTNSINTLSVTVVIPTYNRRTVLSRCLESVLGQTVQPAEIIVVDDGSTDGTGSWVRTKYPQIHLYTQDNKGVSFARNLGIRNAETEWIAFLDSDDAWLPEKLEKQMALLEANPQARLCHTEERWMYKGKERSVARAYLKKGGWIFKDCLPVCAISPSTVVIHKSVFDEFGLFDETLPACEDYDLWLRITPHMAALLVDEPLIEKHGGHEDQLSAQRGLDKYRIQGLQKLLMNGDLSREDRDRAILQLKEKCRVYAKGLEKYGKSEEAKSYMDMLEMY
jgi:glycosyltransferase involved in cell wall biosynthesis